MKICIIKLSAMGDIIHTMIVLQFVKQKYPNCTIDWIVEDAFSDILQNNPHIDNILTVNIKSIKKQYKNLFTQIKLLRKYSNNNYDFIFDTQGLFKSALVCKILASKNTKIVGFDKNSIREKIATLFYHQKINIGYEKNVILRNLEIFKQTFDIDISQDDILNKDRFLYFCKFDNVNNNNYIIFVVGASRANKIYPKEKFLQIAQGLIDENIIVVWANEYEKKVAIFLEKNSSNITMAKKMNLDKLKAKISNSKLLIGGDTGPTHVAWGLNTPSITIFGNTPHNRNTYITNINKTIKSKSKVDALKLNKSDFSIKDIDSKEIINLAKELLRC
jgi:heptosyltransferase-1